jgi:hypothetical protein
VSRSSARPLQVRDLARDSRHHLLAATLGLPQEQRPDGQQLTLGATDAVEERLDGPRA